MKYVLNVVNTPYTEFEIDIEFCDYENMMRWLSAHYTDWTEIVITTRRINGLDIAVKGLRSIQI